MSAEIDLLHELSENYCHFMAEAQAAHDAYSVAREAATLDDVIAAASRPSAYPPPVGVWWPPRTPDSRSAAPTALSGSAPLMGVGAAVGPAPCPPAGGPGTTGGAT